MELEELLGKKKVEIAFYEDTKKMVQFAEEKNDKQTYIRLSVHYANLAMTDGIREDMKKVSEYFLEKAKNRND